MNRRSQFDLETQRILAAIYNAISHGRPLRLTPGELIILSNRLEQLHNLLARQEDDALERRAELSHDEYVHDLLETQQKDTP